ncbi:MAG: cellulosome enzyme, dockerin type I, partial [uncultured bacterium]
LTASATGAWYLHVLSINTAGDVASTQTYGPFIYQKGSALSLTKDVGINTGDTTSSLSPKPFASVWTLLSGNWLVAMIIALIAITILVPLSVLIPNKKGKGELTETLRHLPSFLSKEPSLVFNKVVPKGGNGTWPLSYSHYKKAYSISRRAAVVAIVLIIIKIVIAILLWASPFPAVTAYSDDGQEIQPGDELTYKIIYKNETGSTLNDLIVSDDIPSGTDFISGSLIINGSRQTDAADTDNAYVATNKVVFNISTVVDNASGYVMFRTKVNLPNTEDKVQNSAISKSDEISWVSSNATSNLLEKAGVSGYVFRDKNGNKAKDGEETGISSVAMKIYEDSNGDSQLSREKDTLIATKITDLKGKYEFAGLRSGNYFIDVSESTLAAYELTTSNPLKVTLERGKNFEDINFGYKLKQGKQDKKEEEDKKEAEDEGRDEGKQVKESTKISILLVPTGRDASIAEGILQFMVSTNDDKFKVYRNANFVISVQPKKPVINVIAEVSSGLVDVYELFDEDGDGVYAAEIRAPVESGLHTIKITENYTDGTSSESVREFYVEPVGYVYQLFDNMEVRLSDAKVTLFNKDGNEWKVWNAVEYNQKNPQITSESGEYTLMVSGGIYKLTAEKEGYESFESDEIRLADPGPINIKIELFKSRFMAEIAEGVVEDYYFWIGASVVIVITGVTVMLLRRRYKKGMKY